MKLRCVARCCSVLQCVAECCLTGNCFMSIHSIALLTCLVYLRTKTQLVHFNNPSFVHDLYGPGLVCFANYTSSQDCDKAICAMRDWFAKQDWAKRITLHVKK